jgi:RNA polymerase primary sigma factor
MIENDCLNPPLYYFKEIANVKPLSIQEEKALIWLVRNGDKKTSKKAKDKLIKANLRFVVSVAKNYQGQGIDLQDLISVGNQGLLRSLKSFDENKNFKLISYAVWWIRQQILFAMASHSRIIRIPLHSIAVISEIRKAHNKLEQKCQGHVTTEAIATEINKSKELVRKFQMIDTPAVSLNTKIYDDVELIDTIQDSFEEPEDRAALKKTITSLIGSLRKERDQDVIKMYFGICYESTYTLDQIGQKYGISRERVRQIKEYAIKRLKEASNRLKEEGVL